MATPSRWSDRRGGGPCLRLHTARCAAPPSARIARIPALGSRLHIYQLARLISHRRHAAAGGTSDGDRHAHVGRTPVGEPASRLCQRHAGVREGRSIGDSMEQHGLTTRSPRACCVSVSAAATGRDDGAHCRLLRRELSRWVNSATRLIEPALMSLIGIIIGVIVVLMYFPIFELAGSIK